MDGYELVAELGRGAMTVVYLSRCKGDERLVALKQFAAFHSSSPAFVQRFVREASAAAVLSHPSIVCGQNYFEYDLTPYIAMEYVERGTLRRHVGAITLGQVGGVLDALLAGLGHAEEHGLVHRNLTPENVMVNHDGRVQIADFGIAKAIRTMQTSSYRTAASAGVGNPRYMAPEQAMNLEVGPWSDLYSVGCIAFELLTGRAPFDDARAPIDILRRQVTEPIPPAKSINPQVDKRLSAWAARLLAKDPKQRPRSAEDAWDELEATLTRLLGQGWRGHEARLRADGEGGETPIASAEAAQRTTRRRPGPEPSAWRRTDAPHGGSVAVAPARSVAHPQRPVTSTRSKPRVEPTPRPPARPQDQSNDGAALAAAAPPASTEPSGPTAANVASQPTAATLRRPPAPAEKRGVGSFHLLLMIGAVLAAGFGLYLAGRGGDDTAQRATMTTVAHAGMKLTLPAGWRPVEVPQEVSPLAIADPVAFGVSPGGEMIVFGSVSRAADNVNLLSDRLLSVATVVSAGRVPVALGRLELQAYRYQHVQLAGSDRALTLYVAPTAEGVATIACRAGRQSATSCDAIADTIQVGAEPYAVGPSARYAVALSRTFGDLRKAARSPLTALRAAATPTVQAAAARELRDVFRTAWQGLAVLTLSPADRGVNARLVVALNETADAYGRAADAARHNREREYRRASTALEQANRQTKAAFAALTAAGYQIGS